MQFHRHNIGFPQLILAVVYCDLLVDPGAGELVSADQDAKVKITYAPEKNLTIRTQVRLTVEPFQQQILIPITFASEPAPAK